MKIYRHHLRLDETTYEALKKISKATLQTRSSLMRRYIQEGVERNPLISSQLGWSRMTSVQSRNGGLLALAMPIVFPDLSYAVAVHVYEWGPSDGHGLWYLNAPSLITFWPWFRTKCVLTVSSALVISGWACVRTMKYFLSRIWELVLFLGYKYRI